MALSLDEVNMKKAKAKPAARKAAPEGKKQRVARPWEETKVETTTAKTETTQQQATKAGQIVRHALKTAFEYKDKVMASPKVQTGWTTATQTVQTVLDKNPKVIQTWTKIDTKLKVTEKVTQALTIAKLVEQEIRQKL